MKGSEGSASGVLSHADALVYIANSLVVVVVSCIQVVKLLSRGIVV